MVVGAPGNLDGSHPWHEILHEWNMKAQTIVGEHQVNLWSHRFLDHIGNLDCTLSANLPPERWIQRARIGNLPVHALQDILDMTGHQNVNRTPGIARRMADDWYTQASNTELWTHLTDDFVFFLPLPAGPNEEQ